MTLGLSFVPLCSVRTQSPWLLLFSFILLILLLGSAFPIFHAFGGRAHSQEPCSAHSCSVLSATWCCLAFLAPCADKEAETRNLVMWLFGAELAFDPMLPPLTLAMSVQSGMGMCGSPSPASAEQPHGKARKQGHADNHRKAWPRLPLPALPLNAFCRADNNDDTVMVAIALRDKGNETLRTLDG